MRWLWVVVLGTLCAGCVATGTEEDAQPPEEVGTASSHCWWWGPGPTGVVAPDSFSFGTAVEEVAARKVRR